MDNVQILNAIRTSASAEYNDRIPEATKTNLKEVAKAVFEYPTAKNELIESLVNKVAKTIFFNKLYSNPYKFFKKGTLEYGKSIENVMIDLIKAKSYNNGTSGDTASELLKTEKPKVGVEYLTENFRHMYKASISDSQLKGAILNLNGLDNLTNMILQSALNSAEYDEFILIKHAICSCENEMTINGYSTLTDDKKAKELTKTIKSKIMEMGFLSSDYSGTVNGQKFMTFSKPNELVIFVTPTTKANIDVELLSSAFNISKAEVESRLVLIDKFVNINSVSGEVTDDTDTLAIICDDAFIQFWETENTSESQRVASTLTTNIFQHRWGICATSKFVNHLKIKKAE